MEILLLVKHFEMHVLVIASIVCTWLQLMLCFPYSNSDIMNILQQTDSSICNSTKSYHLTNIVQEIPAHHFSLYFRPEFGSGRMNVHR